MYEVKASERESGLQFGDMLMDLLAVTAAGLAFRARVWGWVERWPWPRIAAWGIFLLLASWAYKAAMMLRG